MQEIILLAVVLALGMGAYWAMVLFPKQRDFSKRQKFVRTLAEGDEVITAGGIIGRVINIEAESGIAHVELAPNLVVRMVAASLLTPFDPEELAKNARMGIEQETPTN